LQRVYQVDLADMYRGLITPRKISVLTAYLPRGSCVWEMVGGQQAITAEVEAAWMIEHALVAIAHAQAGGKGKAPEPREYPPGILEQQAKAEYTESRAEAFRRKHLSK
jgi:hypothetical protein